MESGTRKYRYCSRARAGGILPIGLVVLALLAFSGCSDSGTKKESGRASTGASGVVAAAGGAGGAPRDTAEWSAIPAASAPYNLILLSLDTTRRDRLSCYGYPKKTTPNLDRIASEGVLFEDANTPVPVTLPSHSTMMTGLYPFEHGVRHNGSYILSDSLKTLAELLKGKGYETGAVLGAFPVDHRFGLAQGFDSYDDRFPPITSAREGDTVQRTGAEVTRLASAWIAQHGKRPFFLWVHYFDPHAPYHPPEPYKSRFADEPYAGEVASMDEAIGRLYEDLKGLGLLEKTVIIVAGDHGEGLGDHKEPTHSMFIYGATQHVPFLLRLPDAGSFSDTKWRDRKVGGLVSLVDLLPTAWNALGLARDELPPVAGKSLLPLVEGSGTAHEWVYYETLVPDLDYGLSELRGLQVGEWKYIRAPQPELYNLQKDPGELQNQAQKEADRVRTLESRLQEVLKGETGRSPQVAMDAETAEKLKSLGYLQGAGTAGKKRADPKELTGVGGATARAMTLAEANRTEQALAVLDSLLRVRPDTRMALRLRANYLLRLDRGQEALDAYAKALADCQGCPDEFRLLQEQASAYLTAGNADEALRRAQLLLKARPQEQGLNLLMGEILEKKGDVPGALAAYQKEADLYPLEPLSLVKIGNVEVSQGRNREAEDAYRKAVAVNPQHADALVMLSELLAKTGRRAEAGPLVDRALAANPAHPGAHYRKAWLLRAAGDKEGAIQHYRAALQGQPRDGVLLYEMASLYGEMGRTREAEEGYRSAIQMGNAPAGAYSNLGIFSAQAGKLPDAVQYWQQALTRKPTEQEAAIIRGNIRKAQEMMKKPR